MDCIQRETNMPILKFINNKNKNNMCMSEYVEIPLISQVTEFIKTKSLTETDKKTLIVCDIDDTLIRPYVNVGSDTWFNFSVNSNKDIQDILDKTYLLFSMLKFKGVEENNTNDFVKFLKSNHDSGNVKFLCLSSRNVIFMSHTIKHLTDCGYSDLIQKNSLRMKNSLHINVDSNSNNVTKIRYLDNLCLTSGHNKGIVLLKILTEHFNITGEIFNDIFFIDDTEKNVNMVSETLNSQNLEFLKETNLYGIKYTYMEEHKNKYSVTDFVTDTKKVDDLLNYREYMNTENSKKRYVIYWLIFAILLLGRTIMAFIVENNV